MPARVEHNAREVAKTLQRARSRFIQGPLALGVEDFATRAVVRARSRGFGFTDRTGRLRSSIQSYGVMVRGTRVTGRIGSQVFYARFVEVNNEGRYSYLRRAVRELGREGLRESILRHVVPWLEREGLAPGSGRSPSARSQFVARFPQGPLGGG